MHHSPAPLSRTRSVFAAVAVTIATQLISVAPAGAHAELVATSPAANAVVKTAPRTLTVTFDQPVTAAAGDAQLLNARGKILARAAASTGATITIATPKLRPGRYVVRWRITSADGHVVVAASSFAVNTPTPAAKPLSGYLSDGAGNVSFMMNGNRAGVRTAVISLQGAEGTMEWKHPKFGAPMIWKLSAGANAMSAGGMLPAAGTWTVTARVRTGEFDERVLTGKIEVKA